MPINPKPRDFIIYRPRPLSSCYWIREVAPHEKEAVLKLLRAHWPSDRHFDLDFFSKMDRTFICLGNGGRVVGTASAGRRNDEASVHWVAVEEKHRRYGIGANLVEAVLRYWQQRGVERIFVRTNPTTEENVAFYHRLGFLDYECLQV